MGELVKVMMFWVLYYVELEGGERCKCPGRMGVTLRQVVGSRGLDMVLDVL